VDQNPLLAAIFEPHLHQAIHGALSTLGLAGDGAQLLFKEDDAAGPVDLIVKIGMRPRRYCERALR